VREEEEGVHYDGHRPSGFYEDECEMHSGLSRTRQLGRTQTQKDRSKDRDKSRWDDLTCIPSRSSVVKR
jgi:hypothetical protein